MPQEEEFQQFSANAAFSSPVLVAEFTEKRNKKYGDKVPRGKSFLSANRSSIDASKKIQNKTR